MRNALALLRFSEKQDFDSIALLLEGLTHADTVITISALCAINLTFVEALSEYSHIPVSEYLTYSIKQFSLPE